MYLFEHLPRFTAGRLNGEIGAEDVTQLGAIPIPSSGHLLLLIIVVRGRQQRAKDELGDIHLLCRVHLHWNPTSVVPDTDEVVLTARVSVYGSYMLHVYDTCDPTRAILSTFQSFNIMRVTRKYRCFHDRGVMEF